ncbi:hypothetical protein MRX96_001289 [Rhipicephalus microplus]
MVFQKRLKTSLPCPFYQCALEDIFPDNRDTEAKRDDKVDQLLQCGFLYGKNSKQALQHKRLQRSARSPQLHGAGEQHRMAADRQQSGSKHSKTRTSMSISALGVVRRHIRFGAARPQRIAFRVVI